jgi:hypothetical protein
MPLSKHRSTEITGLDRPLLRGEWIMWKKSALFATVVAGVAAASAGSASAWSRSDGWRDHSSRHGYHKPYLRTETKCFRSHRVVLRINQYGDVVSRAVVGRCGNFANRVFSRMNKN